MSNSDVEAIKARLNIVDIVGKYVPSLKPAGRNHKGLCPFHKEKTPSFMVNPDMQRYKCFGCGKGGDIYTFLQEMEGIEFPEALKMAAEIAGYELKNDYQNSNPEQKTTFERNYKANELAAKFWHYIITQHKIGEPGREYARKRDIRREEIDNFLVGYAPKGNNLKSFLLKKGFSEQELIRFGLLVERKGETIDKFRDRFMLTIKNLKGQVIGFSGRIITPSDYAPKYLNTPETPVYHKSQILMGLYQAKDAARQEKTLILEEGNIDLLSSHKVGVKNIAASGGTALTEEQLKLAKRYADSIYFAFDTDEAGVKAILRGIEIAEKLKIHHKVIDLGEYQDPDDMIKADPQLWLDAIAKPSNTLEYLFTYYRGDLDLGSADGKSTYVERLIPVLSLLQDKVQQQHFTEQLALAVGVDSSIIADQVTATNVTYRQAVRTEPEYVQLQQAQPRQALETFSYNKHEAYFLSLLMELEDVSDIGLSKEVFHDQSCLELFEILQTKPKAERNYSKIADELGEQAKQLLQEVLMQAIELDTAELEQEIIRMYNLLQASNLRRQIMNLRNQLSEDPDDETKLQQLQELTRELKELSNN